MPVVPVGPSPQSRYWPILVTGPRNPDEAAVVEPFPVTALIIAPVDQGTAGVDPWPVIVTSMPPITVGTVDQGAAGVSPWPVSFSGGVAVNNFPASQAVTGTFWQATQPVSGPLTDTQLRASAVPVSGTFFQATQPVSIAAAVTVTPPTLTKGTQGATGFSVQDLKDSGRARVTIKFQSTATATADTLLSLVKVTNGTAAAGATTIAVASTKTLRITHMVFSLRAGAAAAAFATFNVRIEPAGNAIITSQSELRIDLGNTAATIGAAASIVVPMPDGFELSGTSQLAVSAAAQAVTNILSVALVGFEF